ncbi:hypothetical protein PHYSODRAFT_486510, partial [Phytophthora sojae]
WNVHAILRAVTNRTNNPLERFSRELNVRFLNPVPPTQSCRSLLQSSRSPVNACSSSCQTPLAMSLTSFPWRCVPR